MNIIFDSDGLIRSVGSAEVTSYMIELNAKEGFSVIDYDGDLSMTEIAQGYYIDGNDHLTIRPVIDTRDQAEIVADGNDEITISMLPSDCAVYVDDYAYEVQDGEFTFATDMPGVYRITIDHFPYMPLEIVVTAQ